MWPLRMTNICVKIYRFHLLYAREYSFAVAVVVVAVIVVTYLHEWCQVIIGLRKWLSVRLAPSHYLEKYRSSETIGWKPEDILQLNKHFIKYNLFENKQGYKYYTNANTTQSVCEPLSEPMMVKCVRKFSKVKHDTFGKRAFTVFGPQSWNLGYAMNLKHSSEPLKLTLSLCL